MNRPSTTQAFDSIVHHYIDQNGDWKLEGNIEYRSNFVGSLDYALFIDAGNVWLMRSDALGIHLALGYAF